MCGKTGENTDQAKIVIECEPPAKGNILKLNRTSGYQIYAINFCEVVVIGYLYKGM